MFDRCNTMLAGLTDEIHVPLVPETPIDGGHLLRVSHRANLFAEGWHDGLVREDLIDKLLRQPKAMLVHIVDKTLRPDPCPVGQVRVSHL
jgi:hypothetical protein